MVYLFLLPHLLLLSAPDLISAAAALLIYAAAGYGVIRFEKTHSPKPLFRFQYPLITSAATLALGALFYLRWRHATLFLAWESLPGMPAKRLCGAAAAAPQRRLAGIPGRDSQARNSGAWRQRR